MKTVNITLTLIFIIGLLTVILTNYKLFGLFIMAYMMVAAMAVNIIIFINKTLK